MACGLHRAGHVETDQDGMEGHPEASHKDQRQQRLDPPWPVPDGSQVQAEHLLQRIRPPPLAIDDRQRQQPEIKDCQEPHEAQDRVKQGRAEDIAAHGQAVAAKGQHYPGQVKPRRPARRPANLPVEQGPQQEQAAQARQELPASQPARLGALERACQRGCANCAPGDRTASNASSTRAAAPPDSESDRSATS